MKFTSIFFTASAHNLQIKAICLTKKSFAYVLNTLSKINLHFLLKNMLKYLVIYIYIYIRTIINI